MASAEVANVAEVQDPVPSLENESEPEPPGKPAPVRLALNEEQVERYYKLLSAEGEETASSHLSEELSLSDYRFDSRSAIKLDYAVYALEFARSQGFGLVRTAAIFKLASDILEACIRVSTFAECFEILKSRLLAMTSHKPGADSAQLSPQQVAAVAAFFSKTFFRHFRLYSLAFTQEQGFTQHEAQLMVETACVPSLEEALNEVEKEQHDAEKQAEKDAKLAAEVQERAAEAAEREAKKKEEEEVNTEAARQAELLRKPATLDEAIQHLVTARLTEEKEALAAEYAAREAALSQKLAELKEKIPEPEPDTKGKKK